MCVCGDPYVFMYEKVIEIVLILMTLNILLFFCLLGWVGSLIFFFYLYTASARFLSTHLKFIYGHTENKINLDPNYMVIYILFQEK